MACIPLLPKGILLIFHTTRRYKRFFVNYRLSVDNIDNNVRSGVANHLCAYESVILVVIPWPANTLQNNAPVRTWTVRHYSTYIVIFLKRHNGLINGNRRNNLHTSTPCLTHLVYVLVMTSVLLILRNPSRFTWCCYPRNSSATTILSHLLPQKSYSSWRHQMETFSALLVLCAGNTPVTGGFPSQRPVTRNFDVFFICGWTNGWVNNDKAGDLKRHRDHYDVTVMFLYD